MASRRNILVAAAGLVALIGTAAAFAGSAGHRDRSFGRGGIVVLKHPRGIARAVAVGRHNRIVLAGGRGDDAFKVARLLGDGRVDHRFGQNGIVSVGFGADSANATSVAVDRKGGTVVAGTVCSDPDTCHFAVARLLRDGRINEGFGGAGTVEIDFPRPFGADPQVAFGPRGRVVVAGSDCQGRRRGACDIAVASLRRDGTLDPQFGNGGKVVSDFAPVRRCEGAYRPGSVSGMDLDSRGRIVVGGSCSRGGNASVARFTRTGNRDRSFGEGGIVDRDVDITRIRALIVDRRDRIDVAGTRRQGFAVARFGREGKLDRSFGRHGTATARFADDPKPWNIGVQSIAVDSVGRIVVGGFRPSGPGLARFKPNGRVDRRFADGGTVVLKGRNKDLLWNGSGNVAVDARDRVVGAGAGPRAAHFAVYRLLG
jgi:uncharacterized delta-60 repeat protein